MEEKKIILDVGNLFKELFKWSLIALGVIGVLGVGAWLLLYFVLVSLP